MDEHTRLRWICAVREHVRRAQDWGLKDVDVLRHLLSDSPRSEGWLSELEPDLHRWYGAPMDVPPDAVGPGPP